MFKKYLILTTLSFLILSGCGPVKRYYEPIMLKSDLNYMPKPISYDTLKTSNYVSAIFGSKVIDNHSNSGLFLKNFDSATFGQLNVSRSHYFNHWNLGYRLSGFAGEVSNYSIDKEELNYYMKKGFYGGQLQTSANYVISSDRIDFRIIGVDFIYSKEAGDFLDFRRQVANTENFYSITNSDLFSGFLTTEIIWHTKSSIHNQFGFKMSVGKVFGDLSYQGLDGNSGDVNPPENKNISLSFFTQFQRFHFIIEQSRALRTSIGYRF